MASRPFRYDTNIFNGCQCVSHRRCHLFHLSCYPDAACEWTQTSPRYCHGLCPELCRGCMPSAAAPAHLRPDSWQLAPTSIPLAIADSGDGSHAAMRRALPDPPCCLSPRSDTTRSDLPSREGRMSRLSSLPASCKLHHAASCHHCLWCRAALPTDALHGLGRRHRGCLVDATLASSRARS